jgi:hypothetical protein
MAAVFRKVNGCLKPATEYRKPALFADSAGFAKELVVAGSS